MNDTLSPRVTSSSSPALPHHKLLAYGVAVELLLAVRRASVRDAKLRDEALRSSKSACLNCAEGAGRVTRGDKARAFAVSRAEATEASAAHSARAVTSAPVRVMSAHRWTVDAAAKWLRVVLPSAGRWSCCRPHRVRGSTRPVDAHRSRRRTLRPQWSVNGRGSTP